MVRQDSAVDHRQRWRFRHQLRTFAGRRVADHDSDGLRHQILRTSQRKQTAFLVYLTPREDEVRLGERQRKVGSQGTLFTLISAERLYLYLHLYRQNENIR